MKFTYLLMLFFVFVTLYGIAVVWVDKHFGPKEWITLTAAFLWALLGTFFFHNVW